MDVSKIKIKRMRMQKGRAPEEMNESELKEHFGFPDSLYEAERKAVMESKKRDRDRDGGSAQKKMPISSRPPLTAEEKEKLDAKVHAILQAYQTRKIDQLQMNKDAKS